MSKSKSEKKNEFLFSWTIENFKFVDRRKDTVITSPTFIAHTLNSTQWRVDVKVDYSAECIACYLWRCEDEYLDNIRVGSRIDIKQPSIECALFSELNLFKKNTRLESKNLSFYQHILPVISNFDKQALLKLECRIWLLESEPVNRFLNFQVQKVSEISPKLMSQIFELKKFAGEEICKIENLLPIGLKSCSAVTRIDIEHIKLDWIVERFKELKVNDKKFVILKTLSDFSECAVLCFYMDVKKCLHMDVQVNKLLTSVRSMYCTLQVRNAATGKIIKIFEHVNFEKTLPKCLTISDIINKSIASSGNQTLLSNDNLDLSIEIVMTKGQTEYFTEKHHSVIRNICDMTVKETDTLSTQMKDVWLSRKYTDATLQVGEDTIPVHKIIVCACSPVLEAMFSCDMQEKATGVAKITDVDLGTLNRMLLYMYSEQLEDMDVDECMKLYEASDRYQFMKLMQECSDILKRRLTSHNVTNILLLAEQHSDSGLRNVCAEFLCKNVKEVFLLRDE